MFLLLLRHSACPTSCNAMDHSRLGPSVHGISQARRLEGVVISFPRGSSQPRDQTHVSWISRNILYHWATCEYIPAFYSRVGIWGLIYTDIILIFLGSLCQMSSFQTMSCAEILKSSANKYFHELPGTFTGTRTVAVTPQTAALVPIWCPQIFFQWVLHFSPQKL